MPAQNPPPGRSHRARPWLLVPLIGALTGGLAFLAWFFRPLPASEDLAGGGHGASALLVDASASGALVQVPAKGTVGAAVVAWARAGHRPLWRSTALDDRIFTVCVDGCVAAIGSVTFSSLSQPEVADPAVLVVDAQGERSWPAAQPRERVLAAGSRTELIVSAAPALGVSLSIDAVDGSHRTHLADDAVGDAQAFVSGERGALLVHPSAQRSAVVLLTRTARGWRRVGGPVAVPNGQGGCFGVVGSEPVAVTFGAAGATWVQDGRATALPGGLPSGQCVINRAGVVLADPTGTRTQIAQLGLDRKPRWRATVAGSGAVTSGPQTDRLALADPAAGRVTFLDGTGQVTGTRPGVGAKIVGREVVVLDRAGTPTWLPLP
jgi:hypothetical protein